MLVMRGQGVGRSAEGEDGGGLSADRGRGRINSIGCSRPEAVTGHPI